VTTLYAIAYLEHAPQSRSPLRPGMWLAWLLMAAMVAAALFLLPLAEAAKALSYQAVGSSLWPLATGGMLAALIWAAACHRRASSLPVLPSGDIVVFYAAALRACAGIAAAGVRSAESSLETWRLSGLVFLLLVFSFLLIFLSKPMVDRMATLLIERKRGKN
jgi:hypothetical protein